MNSRQSRTILTRPRPFLAAVMTTLVLASVFTSQSIAMQKSSVPPVTRSAPEHVMTRGLCQAFIGEYATNDRALGAMNEIRRRGYNAWIEYHGSYLSGTRTYVVYAVIPC